MFQEPLLNEEDQLWQTAGESGASVTEGMITQALYPRGTDNLLLMCTMVHDLLLKLVDSGSDTGADHKMWVKNCAIEASELQDSTQRTEADCYLKTKTNKK